MEKIAFGSVWVFFIELDKHLYGGIYFRHRDVNTVYY